jgi:alpha-tubulin suppressor-like RCC1 family protein
VLHDVTDLEGGEQYFCALELGKVYCWGNNGAGTLGHDRGLDDPGFHNPTPMAVVLPRPAIRVAGGFRHVCALLNDQSVWCWGTNDFFQLGVEDAGGPNTTTPLMALPPSSGAISLGAGLAHTCATFGGGGPVKCWGANADLALGAPLPDGGMSAAPVAVPVPGNQGMITVGANRACSQLVATTYCWGHPAWGSDAGAPVPVANDGFQTLSGYGAQICGIVKGGVLRCWGTNTGGNLYPTETPDACAPGAVCGPTTMAVTNVVDVTARGPSTLVVLGDGKVMGWGFNTSAVLGHAPGTAGDVDCNTLVPPDAASLPNQQCNPTPQAHPLLP